MISKKSCENLNAQGYSFLSIEEKNRLNISLRVTPVTCILLVIIGLYYQSIIIFIILSVFALLGTFTTKGQPIDVLYNLTTRFLEWPKIPPSPLQKRFACGVGAFFLIGATVAIYLGSILWMYVFGISYIIAAGLMAFTHFCIASWLYNNIWDTRS